MKLGWWGGRRLWEELKERKKYDQNISYRKIKGREEGKERRGGRETKGRRDGLL